MKRGTFASLLWATVVAGLSFSAFADVKENPYQVIIDRNPFNLKPIPPPAVVAVVETNAPPIPPPEIKLTGITTLSGSPKAFLQVEDKQTKKASFPPPLAAGDNYNEITVVSIDVENNTVRIKNGDAETTLDFEKNGVKAAVAATPVPHPGGLVPANPGIPPVPAPIPGVPPANNLPGRGAIVSGGTPTTASATPAPAIYGANPAGVNMGATLPPRPLRTDNTAAGSLIMAGGGSQVYNPNPQPTPTVQPTLSREDAEARIEAQRKWLEQNNSSMSRLLPPTTLGRSLTPPPLPGVTPPVPAPR